MKGLFKMVNKVIVESENGSSPLFGGLQRRVFVLSRRILLAAQLQNY